MRTKEKTSLTRPREIEIKTAEIWLASGAITISDMGNENTYYNNEFGHEFFCKNYPSQLDLSEDCH
jgi:hypothetical protein